MSTHTPGPWKFDEENNYGGSVWLGGTNVTVGLDRADRFTGELVISRDEMCANGHLIEAAPDLLAALKQLAARKLKDGLCWCSGYGPFTTHDGDCLAARAAVAKAEGQS